MITARPRLSPRPARTNPALHRFLRSVESIFLLICGIAVLSPNATIIRAISNCCQKLGLFENASTRAVTDRWSPFSASFGRSFGRAFATAVWSLDAAPARSFGVAFRSFWSMA